MENDRIEINTNRAGTFYIALLPVTLNSGFRMVCYNSEGAIVGIVNTSNKLELAANKIVNLGTIDSRIGFLTTMHHDAPVVDMSGTANSYLVSPNSSFQFNATVKGHTNELIGGEPTRAIVLWESFGTDVRPSVGDIIKNASYSSGLVSLETGESGNALVAIIDRDETILWSWHIWVTDYNPALDCNEYANDAGYVMDRNLGALSATPGDARANGLIYQWGRKDPFMGSSSICNDVLAVATKDFPDYVTSDENKGTIEYATQNPMTFIGYDGDSYYSASKYDWYYASIEKNRWNSSKGMYDPCPAGWRVPNGGTSSIWSVAGMPAFIEWDSVNKGTWISSAYCGADTWYPATGIRAKANGKTWGEMQFVGDDGNYYTCTPNNSSYESHRVGSMVFYDNGRFNATNLDSYKATGYSVRCVADK